jgi:hypothetical protein
MSHAAARKEREGHRDPDDGLLKNRHAEST